MVLRQRVPALPLRPRERDATDMSAARQLDDARAEWARGRGRRAINLAWGAVNRAMDHGDDEILRDAADLARDIASKEDGSVAREAQRLADYCEACLAGAGNGTQSEGLLGLITGWRRKRKCPDCAEPISREARVCPHCGFRLAPPPDAA